ncbi:TonB-dependent receptor [uncultured Draconibacterium sp.]|uniref:SusC/RagA family TonB-linked outer membrane protein n=1 Tax=uncultured Draconibacterium sp. TaxID=1573823 RepID=UPI002AA80155|nr:TonB-dependent receptor [uncultured Draconibacterium sp.]
MRYLILALFLLTVTTGFAQVNGTVTDQASGEPLPGVSIMIKGTITGTVTNFNGEYTLKANPGDSLQFSFIGYKPISVKVGNNPVIDVRLEENLQELDEVVVVGYGVQKKSDVTGSVVSFNTEEIEDRPQVNILQSLQGSMAGFRVSIDASNAEGASANMMIRGQNSITASNTPLIILDGVPYSGRMSELNPNDISSIEVLKDASSAAIYGARGANGVILITTKLGKKGSMQVSYEGYYSIDKVGNIPDMMDGETFAMRKEEYGETFTVTEEESIAMGRSTDWIDIATQTGQKQQHNLSLRGGNDKTKYFISTVYNDAKGIAKNDMFKRLTIRLNMEHLLSSWIKFGTNTMLGRYDRSGYRSSFSRAFTMNPLGIPYNEDGSIAMLAWEDAFFAENPLNPLNAKSEEITRRVNTNNYFQFDFPFLKGLSYKLNTGYEFRNLLSQRYDGRDTYDGYLANGILRTNNAYEENWIIENILSYNKTIGKHNIFLTGLYSAQQEQDKYNNIYATNFPNDVMTYYQPNKASSLEAYAGLTQTNHISQMLRANYGFDSRYLITATIRRDGYSAFGSNKKFGLFPSLALGWNMMNESFFKNVDFLQKVDVLKLRLSYGKNGNEAISAYSTLPSLASKNYLTADLTSAFGFYPNKLGNPSLGWETTESINTGVDFTLFGNRVRGLLDMYWSTTSDLLLDKTISSINGVDNIRENIGQTKNRGIEFQISSVNISSNDFTWTTDFNISSYKTSIENIGLTDDDGKYIDDIASEWFIGQPVSVNYDYVFDGIWQEDDDIANSAQPGDIKYKDVNDDGEITPDDKQIIGSRIPDFVAGLTNSFVYKNFKFSFFLNSVYGVTMPNRLYETGVNSFRQNSFNKNFWSVDNPNNEYPANVDRDVNPMDMNFYRDASFLRLQDVTFSYTFPQQLCEKLTLNGAEIYLNLKNMATWTKWTGLDPEFSDWNNQYATPQVKSVLIGLRVNL